MINRKIEEFGLHPIIVYLIFLVGFAGFSVYLFSQTEFAVHLYLLILLSIQVRASEIKRNEFLQNCFPKTTYLKIRCVENLLVALPFLVFLAFKFELIAVCISVFICSSMALINLKNSFTIVIPTPFYKKPFEFTIGFRNTFYLTFFAYFLTYISISVDNFNLGVFSLLLVFFISLFYYFKPEEDFFVWSHNVTPKRFLIEKIKTAFRYASMLTIPVLLVLGIFFFQYIHVILVFQVIGYVALGVIILAKYAAYPYQMNLPQAVLILLSYYLPLMLLIIIPLFYQQSTKRLKEYLK